MRHLKKFKNIHKEAMRECFPGLCCGSQRPCRLKLFRCYWTCYLTVYMWF